MTPTTSRPGDEGCGTVDGNGVEIGICEIEGFRSIQWPEEAGAERFHVELQADAPGEAAVLLCALAASRPDFPPGADRWRVLLDPDGRPLCLSPRGAATL